MKCRGFQRVSIIKRLCFLVFYQERVNPLTGIKELLSNEDENFGIDS
ncbi:MAG: hypothetical protein ACI94N_000734 [Candidatus Arcticimaribacter sp.]|jgi:hypothetical protein